MSEDKKSSSFAVAIIPSFDDDGKWDGTISTQLEEEIGNDLLEDEVIQIRGICGMMTACLKLMEEEPELLDYIKEYFIANFQDMLREIIGEPEEEEEEIKPLFTRSKDGKVITLNFNTKTFGNA
tara:strand:+ start:757 stop:1128 length:372 start_codon:yes stop_codon:yes gene_type:complete